MGSGESELISGSTTGENISPTGPPLVSAEAIASRRIWNVALVAGVVAGLGSWIVGELAYGAFPPRLHKIEVFGIELDATDGRSRKTPPSIRTPRSPSQFSEASRGW